MKDGWEQQPFHCHLFQTPTVVDAAHKVRPAFDTCVGQKFEVIKSHFVSVP
jgi:hypothetical protein